MGVKLLGRYTVVPRDLFRMSAGSLTRLRDKSLRPGAPSWDVMTIDGKVQPLGMTSDWYQSKIPHSFQVFLHTYRVTRAQWCIFATEYENSAIPGT